MTDEPPPPELPDWQLDVVRRLARGERLVIFPARRNGWTLAHRWLADLLAAGTDD